MVRVALCLLLAGCDIVFGLQPPAADAFVPPTGVWLSATTGAIHACALRVDGTLWCWGDNIYGEAGLGDGAAFEVTAPAQVGTSTWTEVHAGAAHTCAIASDDGGLWCWGYNGFGEIGDATHTSRAAPQRIGDRRWLAAATGDYFTCAIRDDNSLWCWGDNTFGEVGDGTMGQRTEPTLVEGTKKWTAVTAGVAHACAIADPGELWCWGTGPLGGMPSSMRPVQLFADTTWTAVSAGANLSCGIAGGTVRCWGGNGTGELGDGTFAAHDDARPILSDRDDFVEISARFGTACAREKTGAVACWGENRRGQLGLDTAQPQQATPVELEQPAAWRSIATNLFGTCGVSADGDLYCTGDNAFGQLGDGRGGSVIAPEKIDGTWTAIAAGDSHACGVRAGSLWCWGENSSGELGDGTTVSRQTPAQSMLAAPSAEIAIGGHGTCATDQPGALWCWGRNNEHQVPGASGPFTATPVQVAGLAMVRAVASFEHTCATGSDGHAYCWGRNSDGQLGRGTVTASQADVGAVTDATTGQPLWADLAAGLAHSCGILNNSYVACWGRGTEGELGVPGITSAARAQPVNLPALRITAGAYHTCAIATTEQLACWGNNDGGEIGDGTVVDKPTPVAITPSSLYTDVSAGATHTCAIRTDQSLWCWGQNTRGNLGLGDRDPRLEPMQVGTAKWARVAAGSAFTCGIQTDGSLWCWGQNQLGQLGDNRAWVTRFVQIGAQ